MIELQLQHDRSQPRWYRRRWGSEEDPFNVVDEDNSPQLAIEYIRVAADSLGKAVEVLAGNDEEIVFNLRRYTNFTDEMSIENDIGLVLAIVMCEHWNRARITFRSEREMVDVLGYFLSRVLESIEDDDMPTWLKTIKGWMKFPHLLNLWTSRDMNTFRIAALALNLIGIKSWKRADRPELDDFGVIPQGEFTEARKEADDGQPA